MPEEMKEAADSCGSKCKCAFMHKVFGLKGLSMIYKVLAALIMVYLIYALADFWYAVFSEGAPKGQALLVSLQTIIIFSFYALVMLTISRVLKVLKKIKHAVVNNGNNK